MSSKRDMYKSQSHLYEILYQLQVSYDLICQVIPHLETLEPVKGFVQGDLTCPIFSGKEMSSMGVNQG